MVISNWYCPRCRVKLAAQEVTEGGRQTTLGTKPKHLACGSQVQWVRQQVQPIVNSLKITVNL